MEKKTFNINGTFVTMTFDDVDFLLGLPPKGDEIFEAPKINHLHLFNLARQITITLQALEEAMTNSSSYDDHFIRRFILSSIGTFIWRTTQRYVRSECLNLIDDVDKMRGLYIAIKSPITKSRTKTQKHIAIKISKALLMRYTSYHPLNN
uniref:Uncharacterized protein n=1 Tax=Oryza punctata TaxID=4537 RepID=A0A0E0MLX8_ORYPU